MYFNVRRAEFGSWSLVHVTGEVDLATAPQYRSALAAASRESERVAVDLTGCDLIDSVGIGVTLGGARRLREAGGEMVVVVSERVRELFGRCRVDEILDLVSSVDELAVHDPRGGAD